MGALELFVSWQAIMLAVVTVLVTEGIKRVLDLVWEERKKSRIFTRIALPAMHGALGFLAGMLLPFRPESVVEYVTAYDSPAWLAYGLWGLIVGGVAGDYLYTKLKKFLKHQADA
jgi:hypothetical protein